MGDILCCEGNWFHLRMPSMTPFDEVCGEANDLVCVTLTEHDVSWQKMSQNGMKKYITHHVHVTCIFIHIFLIILIQLYTCTMNHYDLYALNIWWENERNTYRHPQSKKLTMLGIFDDLRYASCMSIWCSYVGGPSAVPIRWAVFFRNNTHTLGCLFCGVSLR